MAEEKVAERITESTEIKKTKLEKAVGLFLAEDVNMVSESILDDFIKPRVAQFGKESMLKFKEFLADSIIGCVRMIIFGQDKKPGGTGGSYYSNGGYTSGGSRVNYVTYYDGTPVVTSGVGQNQPDTNEYGLELRGIPKYGKACEVRDKLVRESKLYSRGVTVGRYYELVGKKPVKTDYNYGWVNLGTVNVFSYKGSYIIDLPKPVPLSN